MKKGIPRFLSLLIPGVLGLLFQQILASLFGLFIDMFYRKSRIP